MPTLVWTDALAMQQPRMDATHREFIDLLGALESALDSQAGDIAPRFDELLAHTEAHFAQEDRWMEATGFAAGNCHTYQHQHVLGALREVKSVVGITGDMQILRRLVAELAQWFPAHAQMMDAALAQTIAERGYDPETGSVARPPAPENTPTTGCGSTGCS